MQKKKGISLIVLVITIIVMIILAGAIIITLNNSGIMDKANEAVEKTNDAQVQQIAQLGWAEAYTEYGDNIDELKKGVDNALIANKLNPEDFERNVTINGVTITKKDKATTVPVPEEWQANVSQIMDGVPIPKGFVASSVVGENEKNTGLVIYEGEEAVTVENHYTSLRTRNQYVWVPVDSDNFDTTFVRKQLADSSYPISNTLGTTDAWWEVLPTSSDMRYTTKKTLTEVQAMYASVKKYGGFYIARYEAGISEARNAKGNATDLPGIKDGTKVYSVMGKIPYTYIPWTWTNSMSSDNNGAVEVARRMYPNDETNTTGVVSTLTYGVQWDRTLQWFMDTEALTLEQIRYGFKGLGNTPGAIDSEEKLNDGALVWVYTKNSTGTYVEKTSSTLTYSSTKKYALSTGALKTATTNNIYDMAGNMSEWTMEGMNQNARVIKSSSFLSGNGLTGRNTPSDGPSSAYKYISFRSALYIK